MVRESNEQTLKFIKEDLGLTQEEIDFARRHCQRNLGPLPVVLWRYGFITINQLEDLINESKR
jgi:hypothetical protein